MGRAREEDYMGQARGDRPKRKTRGLIFKSKYRITKNQRWDLEWNEYSDHKAIRKNAGKF